MNEYQEFKQTVEEAKLAIFNDIDTIIAEMDESGDVEKHYEKGVKSATGRLRKGLQSIRKAVHNPTVRGHMNAITDAAKELRTTLSNN